MKKISIPKDWPTEAMVDAAFNNLPRGADVLTSWSDMNRALKFALAAAPTPPAPEAEPVAWIRANEDGTTSIHRNRMLVLRDSDVPLYTHPADDGLREAAEEYLNYIGHYSRTDTGQRLLTNLRAELEKKL